MSEKLITEKIMIETNAKRSKTPATFYLLPTLFIPLVIISWVWGGISIVLIPLYGYVFVSILDFIFKSTRKDKVIAKDQKRYSIILWIWPSIQFCLIFGTLLMICRTSQFNLYESLLMMISIGIVTGAIGITFAHELMHKKNKIERILCDLLLGMALYGHFRTEHLLVHHRFVGTKNDSVTARYDENFYRFFLRVLPGCFFSAWNIERNRLLKRGKTVISFKNPFWTYFGLILLFLLISFLIGGLFAISLFVLQALVAVIHLEVVNYIEHYGLSRKLLNNGKYETTKPHHSWNANHTVSNLLLINLQKHSDHHYHPNKSYYLLDDFESEAAPQLPFGYPIMVLLSLFPNTWRKIMNPKVKEWRKRFYPEISDWSRALD